MRPMRSSTPPYMQKWEKWLYYQLLRAKKNVNTLGPKVLGCVDFEDGVPAKPKQATQGLAGDEVLERYANHPPPPIRNPRSEALVGRGEFVPPRRHSQWLSLVRVRVAQFCLVSLLQSLCGMKCLVRGARPPKFKTLLIFKALIYNRSLLTRHKKQHLYGFKKRISSFLESIKFKKHIKKQKVFYSIMYFFRFYRALPRGNTSSGNTRFSCGWSCAAIHARIPSFRRIFFVQKVSNSGSSAARIS